MADDQAVAAHDQTFSHHYVVHFPPHPARTSDPHYRDFDHLHRTQRPTARCYVGQRIGFDECRDAQGSPCPVTDGAEQAGLELHHAHIEFALQQGIALTALEVDYPGVSDPNSLGAWVESAENLRWLCVAHHRGPAGAHTIAHADWEAGQYVLGLVSTDKEKP